MTDKTGSERRVFLMKDTVVEFPELWMEVYIAGDKYEQSAFARMFCRAACTQAKTPDEADLVVFTGGVDINPALYNEKPHPSVSWDDARDREDTHLWNHCVENGIPMLGVCRGAQFGWVMKGGKLWQDVDQHNGAHTMWDNRGNYQIQVSSVHHQAVIAETVPTAEILGDCYVSDTRWRNDTDKQVGNNKDTEAFFMRDVCFLGVQGHPEYKGYTRFTKWTLDMLNRYILENPDVELINNVRRIKPDLRIKTTDQIYKELA